MMSVTGGLLLTPLLLVALCAAAPYETQTATAAPAAAPEKLVEAVRSVHCTVEYVTIWDTKYEDQPATNTRGFYPSQSIVYRLSVIDISIKHTPSPSHRM